MWIHSDFFVNNCTVVEKKVFQGVYISWHEIERTPPLSFFLPFLFPRKKRTKKNSCWLCHWWFLTESICSSWFDPTPKNVIKWARKIEFPINGWNIKLSKSYRLGQKLFTVAVDMRAFCSSFYTLLRHSKNFLHPLLAFSLGQIFCRLLQDDKCHSHITSLTSIWWNHRHKVLLFKHEFYSVLLEVTFFLLFLLFLPSMKFPYILH